MCWRLPDGQYLVAGAAEPLPVSWNMALPSGEVILSASKYYVVTPAGAVTRVYDAPWTSSVEDTLYVGPLHRVVGGQLTYCYWKDVYSHDGPELMHCNVVLSDLVPCAKDEVPFDVTKVIALHELKDKQAWKSDS